MQAQTKNKLSIIVLILLFTAPVIVAVVMNSKLINYSPGNTKNKGDLILPPVKITDDALKSYENYWTVVYSHTGNCDEACLGMLEALYRIRLTKGHKMKKVKLLILHPTNDNITIPEQYASISEYGYAKDNPLNNILTKLSEASFGDGKGLYLLAPEGFLMMSYSKPFKPSDVIDDLGLLLRARKNEG